MGWRPGGGGGLPRFLFIFFSSLLTVFVLSTCPYMSFSSANFLTCSISLAPRALESIPAIVRYFFRTGSIRWELSTIFIPPLPSDFTPVTCTREPVTGPDICRSFIPFLEPCFFFFLLCCEATFTSAIGGDFLCILGDTAGCICLEAGGAWPPDLTFLCSILPFTTVPNSSASLSSAKLSPTML